MKRANDRIAKTIQSGKKPRRTGRPRVINPWDYIGGDVQALTAAPSAREAAIAHRLNEAGR